MESLGLLREMPNTKSCYSKGVKKLDIVILYDGTRAKGRDGVLGGLLVESLGKH